MTSVNLSVGSGKPHDPEKKRLSEMLDALNDIFGAEVSDDNHLQFLTGIAQRISRQGDVMAQVNPVERFTAYSPNAC